MVDIVADGLIRLLGRENVHLDYNSQDKKDLRYTHLMKGFFDKPNAFDINDADALVVSERSGVGPMRDWKDRTGKTAVAFLDGEDDPRIRQDAKELSKVYFKREYLKEGKYASGVLPLPFAALPEEPCVRIDNIERPVFFMGHWLDHPTRKEVGLRLEKMGIKIHNGIWAKADYNRALSGTLVGISVRGWGWDTYRYWEIPYFGACLLSDRLGMVIPRDFEEDVEAVFFSGMDEFESKLRSLMDDPDRAMAIARLGKKAVDERHMSINRARTVMEELL